MIYREEMAKSKEYKKNYLDGLNAVIESRQKDALSHRREYIKNIFSNQEKYRDDFKAMLGWPLNESRPNSLPDVISEKLSDEDGYSIYRMQFEILDGLKMTGLFFKSDSNEPQPLVIAQHGGLGTPEFISGIYGDTGTYHDMLHRVRKHDVHVFAPQLIVWGDEYEVGFDRQDIDSRLKRVGSSITAVEIQGISRILDYFEAQNYVTSFGMLGLSYGGFYTLYAAAVDTRIKSSISCSFFNKRDAREKPDWTWFNSAGLFDDAQIASLVYPRHLCLQMGNRDQLVDYRDSEESFEEIKEICKDVGTWWAELMIFDGVHEFCTDDEPILKMINNLKNE